MMELKNHLIDTDFKIIDALFKLNQLAVDAILFIVDKNGKLLGSLTDGDIRRGLLSGRSLDDTVSNFIQPKPNFLLENKVDVKKVILYRELGFKIIPIVNKKKQIVDLLNFRLSKSYLPINIIIMAGGMGTRLRPLTNNIPKPMLKVGEKPILHILLDHLLKYKVKNIHITVNYLKEQIIEYIKNQKFNSNIDFIIEETPFGTIGSASQIKFKNNEFYFIINSDILTYLVDFLENSADLSIFTIPYKFEIPYGVVELDESNVSSIKEKPSYIYQINSGIYLTNSKILKKVPKNRFYNMTDLISDILINKNKIISYSSSEYWLDIGRMEDFNKAQHDIKNLLHD